MDRKENLEQVSSTEIVTWTFDAIVTLTHNDVSLT